MKVYRFTLKVVFSNTISVLINQFCLFMRSTKYYYLPEPVATEKIVVFFPCLFSLLEHYFGFPVLKVILSYVHKCATSETILQTSFFTCRELS